MNFNSFSSLIVHESIQWLCLRFVVQASILLGLALIAVWLLRRSSAALRHMPLVVAQVGALAIPFLALIVPQIPVLPPQVSGDWSSSDAVRLDDAMPPSREQRMSDHSFRPEQELLNNATVQSVDVATERAESPYHDPVAVRRKSELDATRSTDAISAKTSKSRVGAIFLLPAIWAVGAGLLMARLVACVVSLSRLARLAILPVPPRVKQIFEALCAQMAPNQSCRLVISGHAKMPMAWGIRQPIVLLPVHVAEADHASIQSVLQHELAHARRHDPLWLLLGQLCAAVYWFNPLAWLVLRQSAALAEHASDDLVLRRGTAPADYAEHLVSVVRAACVAPGQDLALAMSKSSELHQRVAAVLDGATDRRLPSRWEMIFVALIGLVVALPMTAVSNRSSDAADGVAATAKSDQPADAPKTPSKKKADRIAAKRVLDAQPVAWEDRRVNGYNYVRGRVVDAAGQPVPDVEVGGHWDALHGSMSPGALVISDSQGQFELPAYPSSVLMAMDMDRKNGGLAVVGGKRGDKPAEVQPNVAPPGVQIAMEPLIDVRGSYWTPDAKRRPRRVWTIIQRMPEEAQVINQMDDTPFFSFRLPAGKYRLRGNAAHFNDVFREFELDPKTGAVELNDLPLPVEKMAALYGQPAPEIHFTGGKGVDSTFKLSDHRGKWVVIDFWGVWCGPCIDEMQQLFMFSEQHANDRERFEIITVHHDIPDQKKSLDEDLPRFLKMWEKKEFPYPIGFDKTDEIVEAYGIRHYPTTIFIDPEGNVAPVNGIWGLSDILKGRDGQTPELFQPEKLKDVQRTDEIKPSVEKDEIVGQRCVAFNGHTDMAADVEFLPNGKQFVTAGSDNTLRFWNAFSHKQTRVIRCMPDDAQMQSYGRTQVFMAQSGNLVGAYFYEQHKRKISCYPKFWRAETDYRESISLNEGDDVHFGKADVSSDGQRFAANCYFPATKSSFVRIYDLPHGTLLHELPVLRDQGKDSGHPSAVKFSPDDSSLAVGVSSTHDRSIQLWDVEQGQKIWEQQPKGEGSINSISFSPDGESLTYAAWADRVEIRATATGEVLRTLQTPAHKPLHVAFSPSGRYLASSGSNPRIKIWDLTSGEVIGTLVGHSTGIPASAIAWSPDEVFLVTVAGGQTQTPGDVLLWDLVENGIIDAPQ